MDRMEIIRIPGYTEDEKVEIAQRHLHPQADDGARPEEERVDASATTRCAIIIRYYTREAGVRNLEREIANLTRKAIKDILMKKRRAGHRHPAQSREIRRRAPVPLRRGRDRGHGRASPPGLPGPRSAASC